MREHHHCRAGAPQAGLAGPIGHYLRGRLHRRIFFSFCITIAITASVVLLLSKTFSSGGMSLEGARRFMVDTFADAWSEPARRDALAAALARDFGVGVRLSGAAGEDLGAAGPTCSRGLEAPIEMDGRRLGVVTLCAAEHRPRFFWPILVAAVMLSAASGMLARRLVRPLSELSRVAEDLGQGRLKSRVRLSHRDGAEFCVVGEVMNQMADRIEKQLSDQRALLATVSHEIRTPLSRMRLLVEFARDKVRASLSRSPAAAEDSTAELAEIEREVTDIDALVSDLLASSRVDFSALTRTALDAAEVGATALERGGVDAGKLILPEGATSFEGDPTLVARAVSNLLENAKRHAGGIDALRVELGEDFVGFAVEDSGPGFEPGDERRIFEPFFRRETGSAGGATSVGLGLALVRRIAEAHGGRAFAQNRPGGGARVGFTLARRKRPA